MWECGCTGVAGARGRYSERFHVEEEEALVSFWFGLRNQYALTSKRLWRRAVAEGATDRDPIAVQKHFDHLLKYPGGMRRLLDSLKRRGRVPHIVAALGGDSAKNRHQCNQRILQIPPSKVGVFPEHAAGPEDNDGSVAAPSTLHTGSADVCLPMLWALSAPDGSEYDDYNLVLPHGQVAAAARHHKRGTFITDIQKGHVKTA